MELFYLFRWNSSTTPTNGFIRKENNDKNKSSLVFTCRIKCLSVYIRTCMCTQVYVKASAKYWRYAHQRGLTILDTGTCSVHLDAAHRFTCLPRQARKNSSFSFFNIYFKTLQWLKKLFDFLTILIDFL